MLRLLPEARRVDAEEMDRARARVEELREAKLRRKAVEHSIWLAATVQHLRQTDEEFHRFDIDGLERAIARLGASDSAVGDPETGRPTLDSRRRHLLIEGEEAEEQSE